MSRHGHQTAPPADAVPEPTFAEQARTLVHLERTGSLGTLSRRHPGHPFVSLMPYATDAGGRPLLLVSRLAMHTQNLEADPRASLLVAQAGAGEDPLALGRVSLLGRAVPLADGEREAARVAYLARHPSATSWVDFEDFGFWRLELADVYFVGGFGAMGWVAAGDYAAAAVDPLADAAAGILAHMNRDHADAVLAYARVLGGVEAEAAEMVAVDRLGFKLRARSAEGLHGRRIAFARPIATVAECRAILIEMLADCRARTTT
jgi:heme iron utilization protein